MENKEKEIKKFALYDLEINDNDDTEVCYISEVSDPAIKLNYVAFSDKGKSEPATLKFKVQDASKRMLTGVFMKAGQIIKRVDEDTEEEYFVRFSADNIERAVKKFFKNGYNKNVDTEHNGQRNGSYIVDSWFIRDSDSNPLKSFGFDVEPGDWCGTVYVEDETHWNDFIKTGKLKGFSVEGLFKFGKRQIIEGFSSVEKFTKEELDFIDFVADYLLD